MKKSPTTRQFYKAHIAPELVRKIKGDSMPLKHDDHTVAEKIAKQAGLIADALIREDLEHCNRFDNDPRQTK